MTCTPTGSPLRSCRRLEGRKLVAAGTTMMKTSFESGSTHVVLSNGATSDRQEGKAAVPSAGGRLNPLHSAASLNPSPSESTDGFRGQVTGADAGAGNTRRTSARAVTTPNISCRIRLSPTLDSACCLIMAPSPVRSGYFPGTSRMLSEPAIFTPLFVWPVRRPWRVMDFWPGGMSVQLKPVRGKLKWKTMSSLPSPFTSIAYPPFVLTSPVSVPVFPNLTVETLIVVASKVLVLRTATGMVEVDWQPHEFGKPPGLMSRRTLVTGGRFGSIVTVPGGEVTTTSDRFTHGETVHVPVRGSISESWKLFAKVATYGEVPAGRLTSSDTSHWTGN